MFEGVIANLLNKVLGDFIEGIEANQLNISILSGDVELFNLSIKPDILENLPLPFKLKYGKVGRIFVDVPMMGLLTSPLKIEVSEVFVLIEPKKVEEFNEKVIEEAFIKATQSSLEKLEEYFNTKIEATKSESSVVNGIINRLIDNIQIEIQNVYVRFEDCISNEKMPYAIGISLKAIELYTWNEKFEKEFKTGGSKSHKTAKINELQIYLDFVQTIGGKRHKITFEELAKIDNVDDIEDDEIRNVILTRHEKGRKPNKELVRTKNFMLEEIKGIRENRYLVHNFNIEVRMIYNKNPKKNKQPMVCASLVIGGKFKEVADDYLKEAEGTSWFELQKQQMACILKFLHFSSSYTQFQAGVQRKFKVKTFEPKALKEYMDLYEEYKKTESEGKGKGKRHQEIKEKLMELEKEYSYETIAEVRQKTINKYTLEAKKQKERQQLDKEIKRYKDSKAQGVIGQIFSAKTEEEKEEDEQDIEDFIEQKEKEFEEKYKNLNEELMQEEPIFTFNAPPTGMPENWAQFSITLIIPSLVLKLLEADEDNNRSIMDVETSGLSVSLELGNNFLWAQIKLGSLDVIDKISKSKMYPYLTHTVSHEGYTGSNAVEIEVLRDTTQNIAPIKISIETKAQQYVVANFRLLGALKDFFTVTEEGEEEIDLSYYGEQAKVRAIELMNQGAAYIDNVSQETGPYEGIQLDLDISAPVIVIPDELSGDNLKEAIILNVGRITTISSLRPFDKKENYKKMESVVDLYDEYKLEFRGFNLVMVKALEEYQDWKQATERIDIIKKITIILKAKRCIEPKHPKFPKLILF